MRRARLACGRTCHWTYEAGAGYRSFWRWPTRAAVLEDIIERGIEATAYPVQLHGTTCQTPDTEHN